MAKAQKKIDAQYLLDGVVVDTSLFKNKNDTLRTINRILGASKIDHKTQADECELNIGTIKRFESMKESETGLDYDPRVSSYNKFLDGNGLKQLIVPKDYKVTTSIQPPLKIVKSRKKKG